MLSAALPPEEQRLFGFAPEAIDWWDYWINVHIPALRRWCYPLMEGRPLESRTPRELDWTARPACAAPRSPTPPRQPTIRCGGPPDLMAIFLTGSTGYLGSYLVAGLFRDHRDQLNLLVRAKIAARSPRTPVALAATPL